MSNSLEFACEDFFIRLFKADSRSAAKNIVHFDEESKAPTKAIVIQAKQGNHNLAGPGGYDVEVIVEYRAPVGTSKAENDLTSSALHEIIYDSTIPLATRSAMATAAGLSQLVIKDEVTGDRSNTQDLRKRTITIPLQAKLA